MFSLSLIQVGRRKFYSESVEWVGGRCKRIRGRGGLESRNGGAEVLDARAWILDLPGSFEAVVSVVDEPVQVVNVDRARVIACITLLFNRS